MKNYFPFLIVIFCGLRWSSPQSGRRSDNGDSLSLARKQLKYSQPPRGRGEVDHGGGLQSHFQPTAVHFVPTAPSVLSKQHLESSNSHVVQPRNSPPPQVTTTTPHFTTPSMENTREQLDVSKAKQEDLMAEICKHSHHSLCDLFRPKSQSPGGLSQLSPAEENNEVPDDEEKIRFKYRHNYPFRRQPRPGDFGIRRSTPPAPLTTTTPKPTDVAGYQSQQGYQPLTSQAPPGLPGPFVTVSPLSNDKVQNLTKSRQPKVATYNDYSSGSNLHEIRVLPPDEFHHLLSRVDGVERKDELDSLPAESRRRSRKGKFHGVPGIAGRDFPTHGSIPMTSFSCIGTKAGFYADLETNCQVYHYCHFDGRQDSFLCSNGTIFNQKVFTCDWWYNVNCAASEELYSLNTNLYKDDQSLFGESVGSNGDDFDLSKLQALLKKNSLEIDSILRGSSEKLIDKSARSLKFSELTSPRQQSPSIGVKSAVSQDLTVSYESKPSGGFNVFYTVPKQSLEKTKMEKIKDLIENINKKTITSESLKNSLDDYQDEEYYDDDEYYDEEDEYYDEEDEYYDEEDEYYEDYESDYYDDETLSSSKTLKSPPGLKDDYYDPGPPSSYYDDAADYIDDDVDFDLDDDEYNYDYEDDYYDQAESRMIIQSSTINPLVLSPTIQKLNALTQMQLNGGKKKRRTSKKRRNKKKSIDRSLDLSGEIERSPGSDSQLKDLIYELTTKTSFTPNTHRTIQLNPHTSSSVPVKGDMAANGNGFLGLFATLSSKAASVQDTTSTPLYLGNIDLKDLQKFQEFQQVKGTQNDLKEYLRLKKLLEEKMKKSSRTKILNKMKQNRRMSVEPEDDSDQKIEALQLLVKSNINTALLKQKPELLGSNNYNSKSPGHMSYVIPSAESLHMYNSQIEKPSMSLISGEALQNSLPFLTHEPSQYNSQSVMINPPANIDLSSLQSNTPNPVSNDFHSTLPFLGVQQANRGSQSLQSIPFSSFINTVNNQPSLTLRPQSFPTVQNKPIQNPINTQTNFGTSFVTPHSVIIPNGQNQMAYPVRRKDSFFPQHQNNLYSQGGGGTSQLNLNTNTLPFVSSTYNVNDLDSHLRKAKEEQKILESQLKQLQQVEANLKNSKMSGYSPEPLTTSRTLISSGSKVPKALGGFPMNFEDMLTTGLQLAEQSKVNSLNNQHVGEVINPRTSWKSAPMPQPGGHLPLPREQSYNHKSDGFSPSEMISANRVPGRPHIDTNPNTIQTDQIHIIGPNCYVMTPSGFKSVGKAPSCVPSKQSRAFDGGQTQRSRQPGSLWDSISSIPLVSKFTKTFGIK